MGTETDPVSETLYSFMFFRIPDDGQVLKPCNSEYRSLPFSYETATVSGTSGGELWVKSRAQELGHFPGDGMYNSIIVLSVCLSAAEDERSLFM
jgi:hypothetical protein